ncbi:MAG: hydrogenase maturation peptidase HycI, partial [Fibrobacterota bacterium]
TRICVLAVGSPLRGDDAAGLQIAGLLKKSCPPSRFGARLKILLGETAPENLTGVIKDYNPSHLIIVDAANSGQEPGTISAIPPDKIGGISFSTHQIPLKLMITYLHESISSAVMVIGIQPQTLDFAAPMSQEVNAAVKEVAATLTQEIHAALEVKRAGKKR